MKNVLSDVINSLKSTQISKHYDSETKLMCGSCESEPLTMRFKGDFTVNAVQILAVCAVATAMCIGCAMIKRLKK